MIAVGLILFTISRLAVQGINFTCIDNCPDLDTSFYHNRRQNRHLATLNSSKCEANTSAYSDLTDAWIEYYMPCRIDINPLARREKRRLLD